MKQISQKDKGRLREAHERLTELREEAVAVCDEVRAKLDAILQKIEDEREAIHGLVEDLASEAQSYFDEKSEKWQDGDAGQQYQEWISELEGAAAECDQPVEVVFEPEDMLEQIDNVLAQLDGGFRQAPDE